MTAPQCPDCRGPLTNRLSVGSTSHCAACDTIALYITVDTEDQVSLRNAGPSDDRAHVYRIPARTAETWKAAHFLWWTVAEDIIRGHTAPRAEAENKQ